MTGVGTLDKGLSMEVVHLTSFSRQTNQQCVTIVNLHHVIIALHVHPAAVLTANFYRYHEHYHVGTRPL